MQSGNKTKDAGEEFGGMKLTINPDLPAHTDFSGGQNMDTPNSFKCGMTPTTPFGLTHLQFPASIIFQQAVQGQLNFGQLTNQTNEQMAEELLQFMPKTPLVPQSQLYNFATAAHQMSGISQVTNPASSLNLSTTVHDSERSSNNSPSNSNDDSTYKNKRKTSVTNTKLKRTRENAKDESRWKSWTREEEVFLVGAVMDRFFKRGSLSSTRADDLSSDDSWSVIKNFYEVAWKNYYLRTGVQIPTDRPANALSRHYKVMKARISQADIQGEGGDDFRTYFEEWEKIYNVDNCLVAELTTGRQQQQSQSQQDKRIKTEVDASGSEFAQRKVRMNIRTDSPNNMSSSNGYRA